MSTQMGRGDARDMGGFALDRLDGDTRKNLTTLEGWGKLRGDTGESCDAEEFAEQMNGNEGWALFRVQYRGSGDPDNEVKSEIEKYDLSKGLPPVKAGDLNSGESELVAVYAHKPQTEVEAAE